MPDVAVWISPVRSTSSACLLYVLLNKILFKDCVSLWYGLHQCDREIVHTIRIYIGQWCMKFCISLGKKFIHLHAISYKIILQDVLLSHLCEDVLLSLKQGKCNIMVTEVGGFPMHFKSFSWKLNLMWYHATLFFNSVQEIQWLSVPSCLAPAKFLLVDITALLMVLAFALYCFWT